MVGDQAELADIAKNDPDAENRRTAVNRIKDHAFLAYIAINDPDERVRSIAMNSYLYKTDKSSESYQIFLVDIGKKSPDADNRYAAIMRLEDQTVLAMIAQNDPDEENRQKALAGVKDKTLLENTVNQEFPLEIAPTKAGSEDLFEVEYGAQDENTAKAEKEQIILHCKSCLKDYYIQGNEGESLQCPHCKSQGQYDHTPAGFLVSLLGLPYGTMVGNCAYCGKSNSGILVRDEFWSKGSFYAQTIDDHAGKFKLKSRCVHCEKDYHIAWDEAATDPLINQFDMHIQRMCVEFASYTYAHKIWRRMIEHSKLERIIDFIQTNSKQVHEQPMIVNVVVRYFFKYSDLYL